MACTHVFPKFAFQHVQVCRNCLLLWCTLWLSHNDGEVNSQLTWLSNLEPPGNTPELAPLFVLVLVGKRPARDRGIFLKQTSLFAPTPTNMPLLTLGSNVRSLTYRISWGPSAGPVATDAARSVRDVSCCLALVTISTRDGRAIAMRAASPVAGKGVRLGFVRTYAFRCP